MSGEESERGRTPEADEADLRGAAGAEGSPRPELRWVQLRDAKRSASLGRNGRVVGRHFHEGYDSWEVLLVTYEGELE